MDAFADQWEMITAMLVAAPELETKTIFEFLESEKPGCHQEGELRTLECSNDERPLRQS